MFYRGRNNHHTRGNNDYQRRGRFQKATPKHADRSHYVNRAVVSQVEDIAPQHNFADFNIRPELKQAIIDKGYTVPTPIQDQSIRPILEGKDVVGIANTGTGKTAAFLIPLINKIVYNKIEKVLIVVPTRELAVQIRDELYSLSKVFHIHAALLIGGVNMSGQLSALRQNPSFIIGTPGRLKDLTQRQALRLNHFKTVVLDEVDRMVDIGFIQDIRFLISQLPQLRQSLFFSATVSPQIQQIIGSFTKNPVTISVKSRETAVGIDQDIVKVNSKEEKITKLTELLRQDDFSKVLVFVRTKWNADKLAKNLLQMGFKVSALHGNKSQNQRLRALGEFKDNRVQALVATDIAARGLDIESVSHVINFDEPESYDDYVHRIGRTGRAQKTGKALTFVLANGK